MQRKNNKKTFLKWKFGTKMLTEVTEIRLSWWLAYVKCEL